MPNMRSSKKKREGRLYSATWGRTQNRVAKELSRFVMSNAKILVQLTALKIPQDTESYNTRDEIDSKRDNVLKEIDEFLAEEEAHTDKFVRNEKSLNEVHNELYG